uniref:Uncharacterized protein n=1 Tax=Arundo donax TaxID=35708 RepID=A0A0A9BGG5_ARUDO
MLHRRPNLYSSKPPSFLDGSFSHVSPITSGFSTSLMAAAHPAPASQNIRLPS